MSCPAPLCPIPSNDSPLDFELDNSQHCQTWQRTLWHLLNATLLEELLIRTDSRSTGESGEMARNDCKRVCRKLQVSLEEEPLPSYHHSAPLTAAVPAPPDYYAPLPTSQPMQREEVVQLAPPGAVQDDIAAIRALPERFSRSSTILGLRRPRRRVHSAAALRASERPSTVWTDDTPPPPRVYSGANAQCVVDLLNLLRVGQPAVSPAPERSRSRPNMEPFHPQPALALFDPASLQARPQRSQRTPEVAPGPCPFPSTLVDASMFEKSKSLAAYNAGDGFLDAHSWTLRLLSLSSTGSDSSTTSLATPPRMQVVQDDTSRNARRSATVAA